MTARDRIEKTYEPTNDTNFSCSMQPEKKDRLGPASLQVLKFG